MQRSSTGLHTYRLVLSEDGTGAAQIIEFDGMGAQSALPLIEQCCGHRPAELRDRRRSLAFITRIEAGCYIISGSGKLRKALNSQSGLA